MRSIIRKINELFTITADSRLSYQSLTIINESFRLGITPHQQSINSCSINGTIFLAIEVIIDVISESSNLESRHPNKMNFVNQLEDYLRDLGAEARKKHPGK
jgi:hypothetical protein